MQNRTKEKHRIKNTQTLLTIITICNSCLYHYFHTVFLWDMAAVEVAARRAKVCLQTDKWVSASGSLFWRLCPGEKQVQPPSPTVLPYTPLHRNAWIATLEQWAGSAMCRLMNLVRIHCKSQRSKLISLGNKKLNYLKDSFRGSKVIMVKPPTPLFEAKQQ